ncbi:MAG: hypothetical protein ACYT04_35710 [Nostoc sp.]
MATFGDLGWGKAEGRRQRAVPMKKFFTAMHENAIWKYLYRYSSKKHFQVRRKRKEKFPQLKQCKNYRTSASLESRKRSQE